MAESPMEELEPPEEKPAERFGWRILRPPPVAGLVFGMIYGAIAGAIIAYDVAVLVRFGRLLRDRISEYASEIDE
jgi:hypothetical protein